MVLNEVRAKYVLGLTATPERQDDHQKIIFMAAGPIRYKIKQSHDKQFTQTVVIHQLYAIPPAELIKTDDCPKNKRFLPSSPEQIGKSCTGLLLIGLRKDNRKRNSNVISHQINLALLHHVCGPENDVWLEMNFSNVTHYDTDE